MSIERLVLYAGAIPFAIIVIAFIAIATVRCRVSGERLKLYILGFAVRDVAITDITSVTFVPPGEAAGWGFLHRSGVVVVEYRTSSGKGALSVSPEDAQGVASYLKDRVRELTGREA